MAKSGSIETKFSPIANLTSTILSLLHIIVAQKMISLAKWKIFTTLQKLPKYVGNLGKIIAETGFEKLPEMQ